MNSILSSKIDAINGIHTTGIGSMGYMAPEQKGGGGKYGFMVDMYALGSVFFDMWWSYSRTYGERIRILDDISQ
jgi:serine/threonine protein kinase